MHCCILFWLDIFNEPWMERGPIALISENSWHDLFFVIYSYRLHFRWIDFCLQLQNTTSLFGLLAIVYKIIYIHQIKIPKIPDKHMGVEVLTKKGYSQNVWGLVRFWKVDRAKKFSAPPHMDLTSARRQTYLHYTDQKFKSTSGFNN